MNQYQVCDLKPGYGIDKSLSNALLRVYSKGAYLNNRSEFFDPTRERLNFEVVSGGKIAPLNKEYSLVDRFNKILSSKNIEDPNKNLPKSAKKKRRSVAFFILHGSRERMRELAFEKQEIAEDENEYPLDNSHILRKHKIEEWAKDMYLYMCSKFGEENIVAFIVHLDTKNPTAHCLVIPIGIVYGKIGISWNKVFGRNKYQLIESINTIHDELAEINCKYGLKRGRNKAETHTKHISNSEYRRNLHENTANNTQIN